MGISHNNQNIMIKFKEKNYNQFKISYA